MKKLIIIYPAVILLIISSCKKDNQNNPVNNKPITPVITAVKDSGSYTIDGKVYTVNTRGTTILEGNAGVNQKVVYNNNPPLYFDVVRDKDFLLFFRGNSLFSNGTALTVTFLKKYNKNALNMGSLGIYHPLVDDALKLYAVGKHQYAEDYGRQQSKDGITLSVSANGKNYTTYSPIPLQKPTKLKPGFQNNSTFEITSFVKTNDGGYNLEAKFSAVIIEDWTEDQTKVENGYLRLYIE